MAKVKIFVSYAHSDLEPRPGFDESRVGRILADIKYELRCHSERTPYRILRDKERLLNISDNIDQEIRQAIDDCDVAIVLLSESYCSSDSCKTEFVQLLEEKKPLFLVETEKVWGEFVGNQLSEYEEDIRGILSAHFWGVEDQKAVPYGWPMPHRDDPATLAKEYYEAVQVVKIGIVERAKDILKDKGATPEPSYDDKRYTVFLACPTGDVKPYADRLEHSLEKKDYSVLRFDPELDLSSDDQLDVILSQSIARCDVYVQLLGAIPGRRIPEGSARPLVVGQYEVASRQDIPGYTWRNPEFDVNELGGSDYGEFLNNTESHVTSFEDFEQYLVKKIENILAQHKAEQKREQLQSEQDRSKPTPLVVIDAAESDIELSRLLRSAFEDHVYVDTLPYEIDREAIEETVKINDAVVIAYGGSPAGQNRAKAHFNMIRRQKGYLNDKQFELAVGDAAPETDPPGPRGPDVHVITVDRKVDEASMRNFLVKLGVESEEPG